MGIEHCGVGFLKNGLGNGISIPIPLQDPFNCSESMEESICSKATKASRFYFKKQKPILKQINN